MIKKLTYLLLSIMVGGCSMQDSNDNTFDRANPSTGQAGSLARFSIQGDYLYIVDNTNLKTFNITNPSEPKQTHNTNIGFGIETIFPYQNKLFIGANDAMYIYDFSNPGNPVLLSRYQHITACDPVVAQGNYAYVTLRSGGGNCPRTLNSLEVIDFTDVTKPVMVNQISMMNPHGLGIDGTDLFVTEGTYGLKRFDITDPVKPVEKEFLQNTASFDVIPRNKILIAVGVDGLYQYDYSQSPMQLLSKIPVTK
jgi:hypothetical protein